MGWRPPRPRSPAAVGDRLEGAPVSGRRCRARRSRRGAPARVAHVGVEVHPRHLLRDAAMYGSRVTFATTDAAAMAALPRPRRSRTLFVAHVADAEASTRQIHPPLATPLGASRAAPRGSSRGAPARRIPRTQREVTATAPRAHHERVRAARAALRRVPSSRPFASAPVSPVWSAVVVEQTAAAPASRPAAAPGLVPRRPRSDGRAHGRI